MELKPIRTDDRPLGRGVTYEAGADVLAGGEGRKVLRNTYLLLGVIYVRAPPPPVRG